MQKIIGFILVLVTVIGGFAIAGGNIANLWQPSEFIIIFGAAIGALVVGQPKSVLFELWRQVKITFSDKDNSGELYRELLMLMHNLLQLAKTKGLRQLDDHIEKPETSSIFLAHPVVLENPSLVTFMCDNLRLLGMGKVSAHEFDHLLEQEIDTFEQQKLKPSHALAHIAEAMPGFGILAAVGGIIITMQHLDGPLSSIGLHVAAALVGTFMGIFGCYCLLGPLSSSMEHHVKKQTAFLECLRAILVTHAQGHVALVATDSGRRLIHKDYQPSFTEMEQWLNEELF